LKPKYIHFFKELTLKIEKLVELAHKQKKLVDEETLNTVTVQVELDKTAEEFRRTHRERQELIAQWEQIIDQMQKRDNQIDQSAQQLIKMNMDYRTCQDELEKKKKFFEDQRSINEKLDKEIEVLDQTISALSVRLNKEVSNRIQFHDEVTYYFITKKKI
jgi:predicted RNase H-like nuclease (RuvC/YqgF family)